MNEHVHTYNANAGNTFCSCGDLNCASLDALRSGREQAFNNYGVTR